MHDAVVRQGDGTLPWLHTMVSARLGIEATVIDPDERLHRYGLTSLTAASILALLADKLGRVLPPTLLWDYPTLNRLAAYLDGTDEADGRSPVVPMSPDEPIAIIGMSCRLPGAGSVDAFWRMLCAGTDAVTTVPPDRWPESLYDPDPHAPGRMATRWGGFLDAVDQFDADFFGMSPREAAQSDPQQRLALELAWEAVEDAGIRARALNGSRTGVFMGAMWSDYARLLVDRSGIAQHTATGQDISIISARIAYVLGLEGPALTIDTACSSALVAVHQACRSLRAGESTLALAGGVHLLLAPESSIAMTKFGAMAPDGRCKPFDARANGYVRGEGGGIVVLKPLRAARADGNPVHAVIRGSAMNNDGPSNGLTAPNPAAQRGMLRDALVDAQLDPHRVDYIEAHGTGTALGDPIEAQALSAVLCRGRPPEKPLRIGSVKSNIGHLEAAAGAAGLIKLVLSLRHQWIPASLHYRSPNPAIDFAGSALAVQATGGPWTSEHAAPVGGVSSFGFGGTNCHVLLQAASPGETRPSAAADKTNGPAAADTMKGSAAGLVFVFAGNGGNWTGMARALSEAPVFRAALAECEAILLTLGYPDAVTTVLNDARIGDVALGQPALCAFQIALAELLRSHGVVPAVVVGHSVGEAAAACVAGILTRQQALRLVVARSRLQSSVAGQGSMALAAAPAESLSTLLPPEVVIAGENGPRATLLAGTRDAIMRACKALDTAGIPSQPIDVPVAYHSPQMDPLRPRLEQELADLVPADGSVPMASTVTGALIDGTVLGAGYWGRNLREPVRFRQAVAALLDAGHLVFVELSPHPLLAAQIRRMAIDATVVSLVHRGQSDMVTFHAALAPLLKQCNNVRPRHLLVLSARSPAALDALRLRWAARLPNDWPDLCHTALAGRERFPWRLALQAVDGAEAQRKLLTNDVLLGEVRPGAGPAFDQRRRPDETWDAYLDRCGRAFVAGADIDAAVFDAGQPWRLVSAPTYPFERERHWLPRIDAGLGYEVAWEPRHGTETSGSIAETDHGPWPSVALVADPVDAGLDAEATMFAQAALAAVPEAATAPRHRALRDRLAAWPPLPPASASDGPVADMLRRAGQALPRLLTGVADPLEVLFPGGDVASAAAVYQAPPFAAAQRALAEIVGRLGRPLRVLELGAGTGTLTAQLLPMLPPGSTLLCSDVSDAFLAALRRRFADWPALQTARFDLDQPTPLDGAFDAIVGANVVHAGCSVADILRALRGMLAPGGVLGLVELLRAPRWIDLVFGLTDGWWRFRGDPLRIGHALMDAEGWRHALAAAGFIDVAVRPDGDAHAVILAREPVVARRWDVVGPGADDPAGNALAAGLSLPDGQAPSDILYIPGDGSAASLLDELTGLAARNLPITIIHGPGPSHAAVAGAARALSLDRPGAATTCVERHDTTRATLQAVRSVLSRPDAEDRLRVVDGVIQVARLKRIAPAAPPLPLSGTRLYVIAGGFGHLGQACARFLIDRGARHLLLVGRRPGNPTALAMHGATVRALALDLTASDAAASLRAAFDRPLGGLVHAAGLADGTPDAVLAAKQGIAMTLVEASRGLDPAFLLLFSSAAGVWGTRGHVAYAAANSAMDRWAEQMRVDGLPVTSVAFGRFRDPGLLSAREDSALDAAGLLAMPIDDAFQAALQAVSDGVAQRVVASVDWPRFKATFEARRPRMLFDHLAAARPDPNDTPVTVRGSAAAGVRPPVAASRDIGLNREGIAALLADLLGHPDASRIDPERGLFDQGLDSLMAVALCQRLEQAAGVAVPAAVLFAHPTVARLADWIAGAARDVPAAVASAVANEPVAIVGMGCRFAGAADGPDAYLARLLDGGDAIGTVPASRPGAALWRGLPDTVRLAGFLDGVEQFDAAFFGISPREAAQLDPQQRLLLEIAWQALEHAGIAPDTLSGSRTGVFIGATGSDYAALARANGQASRLDAHSLVGQPGNTLAGRLAYQFGLHGPAMAVDTACSSSLVALHLAVRALRSGEADMALAGGVNLLLTPDTSLMLANAGLLAPDGRCRSFDAAANGYVRGEGCGIVVLKTLVRAQADGDRVLAVIRGTAVNHDGRSSSFTAPNGSAQVAVIRDALTSARLAPAAIDFIEAHGTGTALGDPVELDALTEVFAGRDRPLQVGSVKAAIGHAEAAAGIAGIIKAVLCLGARQLPPQVHFTRPNPLARGDSPVLVAKGGMLPEGVRRAGVSAFGASGTNAHVVLESIDAIPVERGDGPPRLLLSAASPAALDRLSQDVTAALAVGTGFADACHTAWVGRARLAHWKLADSAETLRLAAPQTGTIPDLPLPRGRRVTLASTPFDYQPFWLAPQATDEPRLPALLIPAPNERRAVLGPPQRSARSGETVREGRLDPAAAWLRDHLVDDEVVLPAAGLLDLVRLAEARTVTDIEFHRRLDVPPDGAAVQLIHDRDGGVTLYAESVSGWSEVAGGRVVADSDTRDLWNDVAPPSMPEPDALGPRAREALDRQTFAAELVARGFRFGPSYQLIGHLVRVGATAFATLDAVPDIEGQLDPMAIDAVLQTLTALLPLSGTPFLPARIGRATFGVPPQGPLQAVARVHELDARRVTGDAWLQREDGSIVLRLEGIELRPAQPAPGAWFHDVTWTQAVSNGHAPVGTWHAIGPGASALGCASHDETGEAALPRADGILDLRPLSATDPSACIAATAALVRAAAALSPAPQLVLVSRGASTAPPVQPAPPLPAAVLMGLQPVIEAEHPSLRCRWVDLDPDDPAVPGALHGPAGRYALRHGLLLAPTLVKAPPPHAGPVRLNPGPERSFADVRLLPDACAMPGAGEVRIAVEASGLNFKDVLAVLGRAPGAELLLGLECAGTVDAVGPGVTQFAPGDPVLAFGPGTLASFVTLPSHRVLRRPDWLDVDTAASLPVACLTAWHGLHDLAAIQPGMRVLVHAGAGGVGAMATRIARLAGAHVFATASQGKEAAARAAGAEAVGASRSIAFAAAARSWAGPDGFDVVLNALGPDIAAASAALLGPGGVFLEIGRAAPQTGKAAPPWPAGVRHIAYDLDQPMRGDIGWFADRMGRVLALLRDGRLVPPRRTVLPLCQAGDALQALGQGRTIGKLVLRVPRPVVPRADGTYLVTGGTGAVGRAMARWLLAEGAGRVVLAARQPRDVSGCESVALDIMDRDAMAGLLATLPGLRGVIHAAGVVRDATIEHLSQDDVDAVLAPKVAGAAHLDALTRDASLDFFLLVSSTAATLGSPGQAAYAGANAWLDRLAASRRAAGLPAAAIGSGPWAGGMFTRLDPVAQARLIRGGLRPMAPNRAASAFARVLGDGTVHRLVMDRAQAEPEAAMPEGSIRAAMLAAQPAERPGLLQDALVRRLVPLLGFPAGTRIEPSRPLRDLGLDSLLSVSLRNELAAGFGLDLPTTLLFDHPTLAALSAHLLSCLDTPEAALDSLDAVELADLLAAELGEKS